MTLALAGEMAAIAFAIICGLAFLVNSPAGQWLLSFLDKIKNLEFGKAIGMLDRLYATHPAIILRIGMLEKLML